MTESRKSIRSWFRIVWASGISFLIVCLIVRNVQNQIQMHAIKQEHGENVSLRDEMKNAIQLKDDLYKKWSECNSEIYRQRKKFRQLHLVARDLSEIVVPHPDQILAAHFESDVESERTVRGYVPEGRHRVQIFSRIVNKPSRQLYFLQRSKIDFGEEHYFEMTGPRMFELLFRVQDKTQPDLSLGKRDFGDQVQIILRQKHLQSEVGATSIKTQSIQFDVPRIRVFNQAASLGNPLFFPGTIVHLDRKWESENSSFAEYRPPNFLGKSAFVFIGKSESDQRRGVELVPVVYSDCPLSIRSRDYLDLKGLHNSRAEFSVTESDVDLCRHSFGPYGNIQLSGPAADQIQARPVYRISK